ncbi:MAG: polyphosphate kinase [Pacificimonas sp.]|jgi:polyphosphate kinase 2 (PPK2 family)|nr:polyphosphate kinase [Pacificimonas sp.]
MSLTLSDYEAAPPPPDDHRKRLRALQDKLFRIQVAHVVYRRRAVIALEGWDGAGKGGAIRRMCAKWDPRYFEVHPIGAPDKAELNRHFLWRFWTQLPAWRNIHVFDRSWYGRVLVERVEGFASDAEWRRAYDEINRFEADQAVAETPVIKLFMHITPEEQDRRLAARLSDPWKRWKTGADDYRNRAKRGAYTEAIHDMLAATDTEYAPWTVIDAGDKRSARLAVLEHVAERLSANCPLVPPELDPAVAALAKEALGWTPPETG